jgi:hypothetical protein
MLRPLSATAALKQLSPRKTIGTSYYVSRLASFREDSPHRPRANSVKRKADEAASYARIVGKVQNQPVLNEEQKKKLDGVSLELGKMSSLCEKVGATVDKIWDENPVIAGVFRDINTVLMGLCKIHETILSEKINGMSSVTGTDMVAEVSTGAEARTGADTGMISLGQISKKQRPVPASPTVPHPSVEAVAGAVQNHRKNLQFDEVDPVKQNFRDAVRAAESSTLVFNLNMGRVPIMNKETMKTKATLALTSMAASRESGNNTSIPCDDTVAAIDDVLSIVEGMEFFGRKTKSYTNSRDDLSNSFCTVPVRYQFRDKDDRIAAEKILQDKCGARCTTPYPTVLRECIRQTVGKIKQDHPTKQIKITVDSHKFCLRASCRDKVDGDDKNRWEQVGGDIPLPELALQVDLRKVPEGFKMEFPPTGGEGRGGDSTGVEAPMEHSSVGEP